MTRELAHEPSTSIVRAVLVAAVVIVGSVGVVGTAVGASGLTVDQTPVESEALDTGNHYVEVVFEEPVDPSNYAFKVVDGDGTIIADGDNVMTGLPWDNDRQVIFDLGDHDLSAGATLHVDGEGVDMTLPITTTTAFVQEGYPHEPSVKPGEKLALIDVGDANNYYQITDEDGTVVEEGRLGEESFAAVVDSSSWDDATSYTVKFGRESTFRAFSTIDLPEDDSDSLPDYVTTRTNTWFTDYEPDRPGTTVKFTYEPARAAIVVSDAGFVGSTATTIDRWRKTPHDVPDPAAREDVVSMLDVTVHGTSAERPNVTVRVPVYPDSFDGDAEDLQVLYYDGEAWAPIETTVTGRSVAQGQEKVLLEGTAPGPGSFAVVVEDG